MPDNCCVPMCGKSGYRIDADGRKVTFHNLPKNSRRLKVSIAMYTEIYITFRLRGRLLKYFPMGLCI